MINNQPPSVTDQVPVERERPKTRVPREKRYRIELGVGVVAKDALDRWRLFVEAWEFPSPTELLHKALDSLLAQTRFSSRHIGIQCTAESGEVGCQYRLLDTIVASPNSKYSRAEVHPSKITPRPGNGRQRVRKHQCLKKKTPGVGAISETTKRILLEHIPETSTGANGLKSDSRLCSDSSAGTKQEADIMAVPSPPSSLCVGTQQGEGLTMTSTPPVPVCNPLTSSTTMEASTSRLSRPNPPSLTLSRPPEARLGPRLVALSRPLLCDTRATCIRKPVPNPMVAASAPLSKFCDLPAAAKAALGDGPITTLSASVSKFAGVTSAVKQEITGAVNGMIMLDEELPLKKKIKGSGKIRLKRKYIPRKKTKGLGGSISEATRRILLEHTDRLADSRSAHGNPPVEAEPKATLVTVATSPVSKLREESPSRQTMTFSGPVPESTKRILLEYYT